MSALRLSSKLTIPPEDILLLMNSPLHWLVTFEKCLGKAGMLSELLLARQVTSLIPRMEFFFHLVETSKHPWPSAPCNTSSNRYAAMVADSTINIFS